ncbi:MAG TPA: glycosyltransferase [Clostridiales bacterium]|nr:glycosyltransferase [Clostridiales bacterium]
MNILFLSVSTGGGHIKAAKALEETVVSKYSGAKCLIIDTLKYISPFLDRMIVGSYLGIVRNIPEFYGRLYSLSEHNNRINNITINLSRLLSKYLISLIKDFTPSVIVCTHTLPLQMVSFLREKKIISVPVVAVVTDYVNHPFWNLEYVDALIVPGNHVMDDMVKAGIPESIIYPYGIPLSENFLNKWEKAEIRKALGIENKLTGLIMGGSLGIRSVYNPFKSLMNCMNCKPDFQIIVVAGLNSKLQRKIERDLLNYPETHHNRVKVLGYANNISDLMDASDFIITKAGGMTISEALIKELPIFLMSPIPGQEERNTTFLVNSGAAVEISPRDDIGDVLGKTIYIPEKLTMMKEKAKALACPYACYDTVKLLESLSIR